MYNKPKNILAFTIVEATLSVAIVGVLLTASMTSLGAIAKARSVQAERRAAFALAQQLFCEIQQQYFQNPVTGAATFGPQVGQTRATFNDVDDYNGYSESPPALQNGTVLTDYTGWTRSVIVAYADPANPANTISSSNLKRFTVTVTSPSGKQYSLTGLRSSFGPYEYTPPIQTNFLTWVGVNLQLGSQPKNIWSGARPLNVTASQ